MIMQQEFFEEDNIQQKLEAEEQEADTNQEIAKEDSEKYTRDWATQKKEDDDAKSVQLCEEEAYGVG